jgi:hypothetical protein
MDKSELKKNFSEFVAYLKKMAVIHDEHCHVVEHKKTGDFGINITGKSSDAGSRSSGRNSGGNTHGGARRLTGIERSPDMEGRRTRRALENSRPGSRRLASTQRSVRRETLFVRLSSHWKVRCYCPVFRVQEEERCRQEEGELLNFGQQQSDG